MGKTGPAVLLSVAFDGTAYRRSVLRTLNSRIARCSMRATLAQGQRVDSSKESSYC
jgi:hypothetical protein